MYCKCLDEKIPLCLTTYNHIISLVHLLKDGDDERNVLLINVLKDIAKAGLKPNVKTLTAALKCVSYMSSNKNLALSLLAEFKTLNIVPNLGSYYYLLKTFCHGST